MKLFMNFLIKNSVFDRFFIVVFLFLMISSLIITILPEKPAKPLFSNDNWSVDGSESSKVNVNQFPAQCRQVRESVLEHKGVVFRTWTPDAGVIPINIVSEPFTPKPFMSVLITGTNVTQNGLISTYIECDENKQRREIFRGSVNTNVAESILSLPLNWCKGKARVVFVSSENNVNVGVGSVYEISLISYLKSTFIGKILYFLICITVVSLIMFTGIILNMHHKWVKDSLIAAFVFLSLNALFVFYIDNLLPVKIRWLGAVIALILSISLIFMSGKELRKISWGYFFPYLRLWCYVSFFYFCILSVVYNGIGHWEPNYRFWPAIWSSDNELPGLFAEAIRRGWDLKGLFGGGWLPTDRPPLMTGVYLILTDIYTFFQNFNDGYYLRGSAYNAASIVLNTLWVPALYWLYEKFDKEYKHNFILILILVVSQPVILFNSIYGWPKAFSASFAIMACGLVWLTKYDDEIDLNQSTFTMFFLMGTFSLLAHFSSAPFLIFSGIIFVIWHYKNNYKKILIGFITSLIVLISWNFYKLIVLPSHDPVTKYALSGDYGFGNAKLSILDMVLARYHSFGLIEWLSIKKTMLLQIVMPIHHSIAQIGLNSDYGTTIIDRMRAWDFLMLSKGNLSVLLLLLAIVLLLISNNKVDKREYFFIKVFFLSSIFAWLFVVLLYLTPVNIHHLPYAAIIGIIFVGALALNILSPNMLMIVTFISIVYTSTVWLIVPITNAHYIDIVPLIILAATLCWVFFYDKMLGLFKVSDSCKSSSLFINNLNIFKDNLLNNSVYNKISNSSFWYWCIRVISLFGFLFLTYIVIKYIKQPLADTHAFRQTQTAVTSYWILKEGWQLAYQTPFGGFPWSIPFEFPIYQLIVAAITSISGYDIVVVGRFVSYLFLLACIWPISLISKRLNLSNNLPWVICAVLWTSPVYVYWGRTFLVETAAIFFTLAFIPYWINLIESKIKKYDVILFLIFASLAILQKVTTAAPVLLFLALATIYIHVMKYGIKTKKIGLLFSILILISIPIIIGLIWTNFTDIVKSQNPFGIQLTSKALNSWNYGNFRQRFDFNVLKTIFLDRSLSWSGGIVGLLLLGTSFFIYKKYNRLFLFILSSLILFILPMMIFINVHFVHEYYQVSCVVFLLFGVSIVVSEIMPRITKSIMVIPILTIILVISNLSVFYKAYGIVVARSIEQLDPRSVLVYKVGLYLKQNTPPKSGLVVFGQGYSSEIAFHSQRKTMTAPYWFKEYDKLWQYPDKYLGDTKLSAIVICPLTDDFPNNNDIKHKLEQEKFWELRFVEKCAVLLKH